MVSVPLPLLSTALQSVPPPTVSRAFVGERMPIEVVPTPRVAPKAMIVPVVCVKGSPPEKPMMPGVVVLTLRHTARHATPSIVAVIVPVAGLPDTLHVAVVPGGGFEPPPLVPPLEEDPELELLGALGLFDPHASAATQKQTDASRIVNDLMVVHRWEAKLGSSL